MKLLLIAFLSCLLPALATTHDWGDPDRHFENNREIWNKTLPAEEVEKCRSTNPALVQALAIFYKKWTRYNQGCFFVWSAYRAPITSDHHTGNAVDVQFACYTDWEDKNAELYLKSVLAFKEFAAAYGILDKISIGVMVDELTLHIGWRGESAQWCKLKRSADYIPGHKECIKELRRRM